jgi:alpha,alpha-trehalase
MSITSSLFILTLDGADYTTANGPKVTPALNDTQKASLYAELASGAETGWDYTMRWFSVGNEAEGLRSLNVRNTVGVDLNSILCGSSFIPNRIRMAFDL